MPFPFLWFSCPNPSSSRLIARAQLPQRAFPAFTLVFIFIVFPFHLTHSETGVETASANEKYFLKPSAVLPCLGCVRIPLDGCSLACHAVAGGVEPRQSAGARRADSKRLPGIAPPGQELPEARPPKPDPPTHCTHQRGLCSPSGTIATGRVGKSRAFLRDCRPIDAPGPGRLFPRPQGNQAWRRRRVRHSG